MTNYAGTPGTDTLIGGSGSDSFYFKAPDLSSVDTVNGGTGANADRLFFTTAGTIAASAFTHVTNIEDVFLANGTNSIALTNALVGSSNNAHLLDVYGGTGNDTINASAVTTAANQVTMYAGGGNDTLTGGAGADTFAFDPTELTSADKVTGGTGTALDRLYFSTAGTITPADLDNVSHIETIRLADGTNSLTLTNALVLSADDNHRVTIMGGTGNDTVNAINDAAGQSVVFYANTGSDTFTGGTGADYLEISGANLTSADSFNGGTGTPIDEIVFSSGATVAASAFTHVSHVEELVLGNGTNSVAVPDALVSSSDYNQTLTIVGGTGNDTVNGSAITNDEDTLVFTPGAGNDTFTGGTELDILKTTVANLTSADTFNGGTTGFNDEIVFTTAGNIAASAFAHVSHVEQIYLANGTNDITLNEAMVASSDDAQSVDVFGGTGADTIDASAVTGANDWVLLKGGGGADQLFANSGLTFFLYNAASESTGNANGTAYDTFHAFDPSTDKISLPFGVSGVTQVMSGALSAGTGTFDSDMATAIGAALTSHQAVEFHVTSGNLSGDVFLVVNPTGTTGYVSGHDYVFDITGSAEGTYTTGTFTSPV